METRNYFDISILKSIYNYSI